MTFSNEDIREVIAEIPEGHTHLRATIIFSDGKRIVFQEATMANLVRAYIDIKTHPVKNRIVLKGGRRENRKDGYAEWQLLECGEGSS